MIKPENAAVSAFFLAEGLHNVGYDAVLAAWGNGCVELACELTRWAEQLGLAYSEAVATDREFPGVFDYEVSSPFGRWFGEQICLSHEHPTDEACHGKINQLVKEFFEGRI